MKEYDLVVIGSGVGLTVISQALSMGLSCALIEMGKMGGTCLTRGCIPSKVLVYPADVIREAEHAKKIGLHFTLEKFDWETIASRMWEEINESKGIEHGLSHAPNLDVYKGVGEFIDNYTLKVKLNETGEYTKPFKGKKIVIAAGGRSIEPPIPGLKETGYVTSETFFGDKFPKKPWKSLIIVGGGIIAAEFAHIFSAFGTKVTIVEMLPRLVATEDKEIAKVLENNMKQYLTLRLGFKAVEVKKDENTGMKKVKIENTSSGQTEWVEGEEILIAVGRRPNTDLLKIENTDIKTDKRGWIITNEFLETNVKNIWAIGDINGKYQFRHKANHDADVAIRNIFGKGEKVPVNYTAVPWAIFTYPQIAHVGLTEEEALQKGYHIYVARKSYGTVAKGFAMGLSKHPNDGLFKMIVNEDYRILGAHAIGPHAALLVQPFVYLMNAGYKCDPRKMHLPLTYLKENPTCPEAGTFMPLYESMVIHPSLNEVAGWSLANLRPVNIEHHHHHH